MGSFLPLAASPHHGGLTDIGSSLTALSCRSRKLSTPQCSFPEADIGGKMQHFAWMDGRYADIADL